MTPSNTPPVQGGFYGLGIAPRLLEILDSLKFTVPTPIQHKAIPIAIQGKDVIGIAQTGTGKTLAFGVPMLQQIARMRGRGLIILPTRELALQVEETLQKLGRPLGLRTVVLIGGASMSRQLEGVRRGAHLIIGTPGRIIDHMQQRTLKLDDIKVLVLDEADRMLDMGFAPQIKQILAALPTERQTLLFSATMPDDIVHIATKHMQLPVRVEIARAGTTAERVEQELFVVSKDQKNALLEKLLIEYKGTVLVFARTRFGAQKICRHINQLGDRAAEIHSNRSLAQRREALDGFKSGKYRVLVATDIASRGIDVTGIELVLNYDIPEQAEDYVHRIGRTGRAGLGGRAITFAMPDQHKMVRDIERLVQTALAVSQRAGFAAAQFTPGASPSRPQRSFSRGPRSSGGRPPYAQSSSRPSGGYRSGGGRPGGAPSSRGGQSRPRRFPSARPR
jgi:ATP-dependent RNA helicase RhlE